MDDGTPVSSVAVALHIQGDSVAALLSWQARMAAAAAAMPGFLSIEFIPLSGSSRQWQMLLQFRDAESLAAWRASEPRLRLQHEVRAWLNPAAELNEAAAPDLHAQ